MVGSHRWLNGHEFEQAPGVGDGQGGMVYCSPWSHKGLDTTERLNWTEIKLLWLVSHFQGSVLGDKTGKQVKEIVNTNICGVVTSGLVEGDAIRGRGYTENFEEKLSQAHASFTQELRSVLMLYTPGVHMQSYTLTHLCDHFKTEKTLKWTYSF